MPGQIHHVDLTTEDLVRELLVRIGEDPNRSGLAETPKRVVRALGEWFSGYSSDPTSLLTTFDDGAESVDESIVVRDIPFWSHCEHHLAPFFGKAHIAYIPSDRIVGLSKLSRVVDVFARRLQVQERLTQQIANSLIAPLRPHAVGVVLEARHSCMESRGIRQHGMVTVTSCLLGRYREEPSARAEVLSLIRPGSSI